MRIFITGATGFIGAAIVSELLAAGHRVRGLARSDAAAASLTAAGAEVHRGALEDLASLHAGATAADGVIHTAFIHDFAAYAAAAATDRRAVEAITAALAGTGKPFVLTSGTAVLTPGRLGTEADAASPTSPAGLRADAETTALAAAHIGVRGIVLRLPPTVHGDGDHGFVPALIGVARATGVSAYVGDGRNRWPAVHRRDAARLYRLALERAPAGARLHAVAEEGVALSAIAEVIGRHLNVPVVARSGAAAADHFGWLAQFAAIDNPTSSTITQQQLGWRPAEPPLLSDLDHARYFEP